MYDQDDSDELRACAAGTSIAGSEDARLNAEIEAAVQRGADDASAADRYDLIREPDGTRFDAAYLRTELAWVGGKKAKFAVWFAVLDADERPDGRCLVRFYNPPRAGRYLARSHAMYGDFAAVTGLGAWKVPKVSPAALVGVWLKGCIVELETVLSPQEPRARAATPRHRHYSVISRIVGRIAGTPPICSRRGAP